MKKILLSLTAILSSAVMTAQDVAREGRQRVLLSMRHGGHLVISEVRKDAMVRVRRFARITPAAAARA